MKRTLWFLTIFAVVLVLFYLKPVFFPPAAQDVVTESHPNTVKTVTALDYDKLTATGFSVYINKEQTLLEKDFGQPVTTQKTGLGYSIATYEDGVRNLFIEANIKDGRVQSIKVAGKSTDKIAPFHFGMSLTELTDITTLFFNFGFDYEEVAVDIELTEEDQNYRPLVAFDNESFAILFFGQENNELYAVDYLNKETLLRLMPYQLNSDNPLSYDVAELSEEEWQQINEANSERAQLLTAYLRNLEGLDSYLRTGSLAVKAQELLKAIIEVPTEVLDADHAASWPRVFPGAPLGSQLLLTTDNLLDKSELQTQEQIFLGAKPVLDLSYTLFMWYSDPYIHSRFIGTEPQALAFAFSQENMVVLLQNTEIETEDSEQP